MYFYQTNPRVFGVEKWGYRSVMEWVAVGKNCQETVGSFFKTNPPGRVK